MRAGPRTASTSSLSAAMIMCPCGGRIDSRPCVEITRACTHTFLCDGPGEVLPDARGDLALAFLLSSGVPLEEAGEVVNGLEVVVQADPLVREWSRLPVFAATCHDGRYPEVGDQE